MSQNGEALVGRMTIGDGLPVGRQLAIMRQDVAALRADVDVVVELLTRIVDLVAEADDDSPAIEEIRELLREITDDTPGLQLVAGRRRTR